MSQILDTGHSRHFRPGFFARLTIHTAVAAARLLTRMPPRRLRAVLGVARRGARPPATTKPCARHDVTAVSTLCAGRYCLPRSLAPLPCRMRGHWPTWCSGVRTSPFGARAWVEAEGRPVGEPQDITTYRPMVTLPDITSAAGSGRD
ncbi:lasso peptide biosynthesis B2 protein [Streptomyces sp. NPDC052299]|uniref:lasso peptide biosynthesis B2 protein n=1 Tax=Streptomyces sp. NPDC052299 TaxID=3155054 RepID=UPI00341964CA